MSGRIVHAEITPPDVARHLVYAHQGLLREHRDGDQPATWTEDYVKLHAGYHEHDLHAPSHHDAEADP
jgi:hypothetical protein